MDRSLRIQARKCFRHKTGTSLPDTHPDAWNTVRTTPEAREAECVGRGMLAGEEVLYFESPHGRWAQRLVARGWAEGVGAPSNYDAEQIRKRGE